MKYFKLDLLTLLISLFIFSSCEKDGTIGLDISPQDSIKSVFTDAVTVNAVTVQEDSIVTSNISQNPFGLIKDPIFGTTEANLALGLSLPSDNFTFPASATLDSAVLVLKYGDEFYGDSLNSSYIVGINQLNTAFDPNKTYYNTTDWLHSSTSIGTSPSFKKFAWNDSTIINSIVRSGPDKLVKVAPQIRVKISPSFAETILKADPSKLKNNTAFSDFIKGLYVSIDQLSGNGGIIFFDLQSNISALEIYYKATNGTAIDTNVATFKVRGASEIEYDRTGTPVQAQLTPPQQNSYSTVYVQPLAGVRTKIEFPDIQELAGGGNVSINKAELVIPVVSEASDPLKPAPRLGLYRTDIAGQRQPVPDNAIGSDPRFLDERIFGGFYNATDKTYTFNITSYVQDLISKPLSYESHTYIAPIDLPLTGRANIFPSATTAARAVLGGKGHSTSPIKLKITYTKPN